MDTIELGGNISLVGFSGLKGGEMVVLKKIIGNYAKRFSSSSESFEKLLIILNLDETSGEKNYEVQVILNDKGCEKNGTCSGKNIFYTIDNALKKIEIN